MRLLHSEPNPLNVLEMRELNFCPSNWTTIRLSTTNWLVSSVLDDIRNWIYNNLSGRFCIITDVEIVDGKMEIVNKIGFEEASESTMFSLGCSVLHDAQTSLY
jgi:hypothetical protein